MITLPQKINYYDADKTLFQKQDGVFYDVVPNLEAVRKDSLEVFLRSLRDDLHVSDVVMDQGANKCMLIRKGFNLVPDWESVGGLKTDEFVDEILQKATNNTAYQERLTKQKECDVAYELSDGSLARVHLMYNSSKLTASVRIQPLEPPLIQDLFGATWDTDRTKRIIENLWEMFMQPQGLIIICGPVRSGKTHLEHAVYEDLNEPPALDKDKHILNPHRPHIYLVADPPEFTHQDRYAIFHQREIGRSASTYEDVLIGVLRFQHNIFGLGEMRGEAEVAESVLRASINGSLITTTAHTPSVVHAMRRFTTSTKHFAEDRMTELFTESIVGMVNLRLVPGLEGNEILAVEYANFVGNKLRASLEDPGQLKEAMDAYKGQQKSQTLETDMKWLIQNNYISVDAAKKKCDGARLEKLLSNG